ncbi:MAG: alpha-amylase [Deltaproteobacteria bacterium]|nr:alpha-amylase [Deltaproteobacteria bacterium]
MKSTRTISALAVAAAVTVGCFPGLDEYSTSNVRLTSNVNDWRDEVIYQLLVDRFGDGDTGNNFRVDRTALGRYQGGDWQGVIDHLDYLQALGVTTLWISPVLRNVDSDAGFDGYHGYWASDLTLPNPHFGDLATLRRLVREAHARGLKVLLDIVTNHMGQLFYYDINNNGRPDETVAGSGAVRQYENPGGTSSALSRATEYDPDFNDRGPVQAYTSLGPAGDAPVVFLNIPELFRTPPRYDILPSQAVLASPFGYHRRGRIVSYDNDAATHQPGAQVLLGDFPGGLKDVATERDDVRLAMIEAYWRWVELTDLDGFRIDTLKHVEHEFWQAFAAGFTVRQPGLPGHPVGSRVAGIRERAMRAGKRNFFMFGEAFDGDGQLVGSYTGPNEMDSVFYFPQKYRVFDNIFQCGDGRTRDAENLRRERDRDYSQTPQPLGVGVPPSQLLVNFMDNHDVSRFLYGLNPTVAGDLLRGGRDCRSGVLDARDPAARERMIPRLHAALTYLLTEEGIPCIYYGTEQDFHGGNDPSNRERLWDTGYRLGGAPRPGGGVTTLAWLQRLTGLRQRYAALRRGAMAFVWTTESTAMDAPDTGMLAFERVDGNNYALVVVHAHDGTHRTASNDAQMQVHQPAGTELVNVLGTAPATVTVGADGRAVVELGPWQSAVFVPRAQAR